MNDDRKLAYVEIIASLHEIPEADKIEMARVRNWECVVEKGKFKIGQKIIFVETDAVMPDKPEYEFLRDRKFRIRIIKLRGQISQGLIIPLPITWDTRPVGMDVTTDLGITKYLTPSEREEQFQEELKVANTKNKLKKFMMRHSWFRRLFLTKKQKSGFPYWISKTDEERIQNLNWNNTFEQFKDKIVYITEKIDFQSGSWSGKMIPRFPWLGKLSPMKFQFVVCSRNLTTTDKNSLYWRIAKQYYLEDVLRYNPNLTIQGEQGDTKVQGNKYGIKEPQMWVFNIIDHEKNYHYNDKEIREFCINWELGHVPILKTCKLSEIGTTVEDFIKYSDAPSLINPNVPREGVVIRCIENGKKMLSFKVINPSFLLKYKD